MNYRHAFHAGNFADVLKHIVLVQCLFHMKQKERPFRVIDTHAGAGLYDLSSDEAQRTGEWHDGVGRLVNPTEPLRPAVAAVVAPYLDLVARDNSGQRDRITRYPGSPRICEALLRAGDTLYAAELQHEEFRKLERSISAGRDVRLLEQDGWTALRSLLPPHERRGLVLVDPPFEQPGEFIRMTDAFADALARFKTGIYLLWYPIKDAKIVRRFHRAISEAAGRGGVETVLAIELTIRAPHDPDKLNGAGLIVANPPFKLADDLRGALPDIAKLLAVGSGGGAEIRKLELPPKM